MIVIESTVIRTIELPLVNVSTSKPQPLAMARERKKRGQIVRTTELNTLPFSSSANIGATIAVWKIMIPQHIPGKKLFIRAESPSTTILHYKNHRQALRVANYQTDATRWYWRLLLNEARTTTPPIQTGTNYEIFNYCRLGSMLQSFFGRNRDHRVFDCETSRWVGGNT